MDDLIMALNDAVDDLNTAYDLAGGDDGDEIYRLIGEVEQLIRIIKKGEES